MSKKNLEYRKMTATEEAEYDEKANEIVEGILALPVGSRVDSNSEFFQLQARLDQIHTDMNLVYTGRGLMKSLC